MTDEAEDGTGGSERGYHAGGDVPVPGHSALTAPPAASA